VFTPLSLLVFLFAKSIIFICREKIILFVYLYQKYKRISMDNLAFQAFPLLCLLWLFFHYVTIVLSIEKLIERFGFMFFVSGAS